MSLHELTQKVKAAGQNRTHEQRMKLLKDARILDSQGYLDKRFFSSSKSKDNHTAHIKT
ncbi:hypothetical protein NYA30BAC_03693 [Halomonas sp. NYA30]